MPDLVTCQHLQPIEALARSAGIELIASGDWWGNGSVQSVYFNCVLNQKLITSAFQLPVFVEWYEYDGRVAGHEAGFHCKQCNSQLVGGVPAYGGKWWPSQ
jgi:hypothetical protein